MMEKVKQKMFLNPNLELVSWKCLYAILNYTCNVLFHVLHSFSLGKNNSVTKF